MDNIIVKTFPVLEMTCAVCANNVENTVRQLPGVKSATVNFAANMLTVTYNISIINQGEIRRNVQDAGYDLIIEEEDSSTKQDEFEKLLYTRLRRNTIGAWLLAIPLMIIAMVYMHMPYANWIMLSLALAIMVLFGRNFYVNGLKHVLKGRANMDTLVALSTSIAFLFSLFNTIYPQFWDSYGLESHVYYEASGMIIAFVMTGKLLEGRAKHSTTSAIKKLMGLQPKTACRLRGGQEEVVPIAVLQVGDLISVHPGEKVPVDGFLTEGYSSIDESMISGEPIPVVKEKDDKVLAGTINQKGAFVMQATGVGSETMLAQIVRMVQAAQGSKAPVQHIVDKVSAVFVPVVVGISFLTFIIWIAVGGMDYFSHALLSSVSVLVIACPCALGLATPTALMVGIGKAAECHILIKDAFALEHLCKVDTIVLDKTGTLTEGKPVVVDSYWFTDFDKSYIDILYTAENKSEHPLAMAVLQWLDDSGASLVPVDSFESLAGRGVQLEKDGKVYWIGNQALMESFSVKIPKDSTPVREEWTAKENSLVYYGCETELFAVIAITDKIKSTSGMAVKALYQAGLDVHLLTGDNDKTAKAVASSLGIRCYKAEALPSEKEAYVKALQAEGKTVAMVGDGINDSQALVRADVSVAMGKGTDIAMDVAMITLMTSDLLLLPDAVKLSRQTVRLVYQNLFWAFIYNLIGIPLAAGLLFPVNGMLLNPMLASAAMAFSSVSVVLNSLRLRRIKF